MPDLQKLESILVADIGSVATKVGLVDYVAGEFRFVAAGRALTTAEPPISDVGAGLRSAIRQIEARTERQLLTGEGQLVSPERPGGIGVDTFVMITSAPIPLRVALIGLSREVSLASALRAVESTHSTVEATLSLEETGGRWLPVKSKNENGDEKAPVVLQDPAVVAAETLAATRADVIVLVGGVDGGATSALYDLANLVAGIIASLEEDKRPTVIFAGNSEARPQIASLIGAFTQVRVVDNVRPTMERENLAPLQRELETLYAEKKITWLPGLNALTSWTPVTILPTTRAFENVVRFLARRYGLRVIGADIGATATAIITARGDAYTSLVRADLGLGQHIERVMNRVGMERLLQWLPLEISADEAEQFWLNHLLRPATIPATRDEAQLLQTVARAALASAAGNIDLDEPELMVLTGGMFAHNSNYAASALVALDALQPTGVFTLAVDGLGLAPVFGAMAAVNPEAAASVIERDGLVTLGTVIAPESNNRPGQIDLRIQMQSASGGNLQLEVAHGSLEVVPLPPGQKATIQVQPANSVRLGKHQKAGVFKAEIEGGMLGLVIDARGRPLVLPSEAEKRRQKVQQWYWDIGGEVTYA